MATIEQVRDAMHSQPFQPFTVNTGRWPILHGQTPGLHLRSDTAARRNLVIHDNEGMHLIDLNLVVEVQVPDAAASSPRGIAH